MPSRWRISTPLTATQEGTVWDGTADSGTYTITTENPQPVDPERFEDMQRAYRHAQERIRSQVEGVGSIPDDTLRAEPEVYLDYGRAEPMEPSDPQHRIYGNFVGGRLEEIEPPREYHNCGSVMCSDCLKNVRKFGILAF